MVPRKHVVRELTSSALDNRIMRRFAELVGAEADRRLVWRNGRTDEDAPEYDALEREAKVAQTYLDHLWSVGAYTRDGSLDAWHAALDLPYAELARRGRALRERWRADDADRSPDEWARIEAEDERRDAENAAIREAAEEGYYAYTMPYHPEMDHWIFIRLGAVPNGGCSRFGLAGEDTEDGPDAWRQEMGGKAHENGISVFRAQRHPDVPGAYLLMEPCFEKALYGVRSWDDYLTTVVPAAMAEDAAAAPVLRVDGCVATCHGGDRRRHVDLGSDGEFLIDPGKPYRTETVAPELVYVDQGRTLVEFIEQRLRGPRFLR